MKKPTKEELGIRLFRVLGVQTASYKMERMDEFITNELEKIEGVEYFKDSADNIYAVKGKADSYPCVVSHKDTVHDIHSEYYVTFVNGYYAAFNEEMKQVGVGGDDKVGVFITLEMLRRFDNIKVAFFSDEEVGCVGSSQADVRFFNDVGYIFECDRNSGNPNNVSRDFVNSIGGSKLMSKKFQKKIKKKVDEYGYSFTSGGLTDVDQLGDLDIEVCMANMSCGYFYPHTDEEVVSLYEVLNTMYLVEELIVLLGENTYHFKKPVGATFTWNRWGGYGGYSGWNNKKKEKERGQIGYTDCPHCHSEGTLWKDDDYEFCLSCNYEKDIVSEEQLESSSDGVTCNECGGWITYAGDHLECIECGIQYEMKKDDVDNNQLFLEY